MQTNRLAAVAVLAAATLALGGCNSGSPGDNSEKAFTDRSQQHFDIAQPPHQYDASQARNNLLAAQDAMAEGANSWTVQTVPGVGITFQCPSVGMPVPFSAQITNPMKINNQHSTTVTLPQQEPYGLYAPDNVSATYGNCVLPDGSIGIFYSEPDLTTFLFDVDCDPATKQCKVSQNAKATVAVKKVTRQQVNTRPGQVSTQSGGQ